MRSRSIFTSKEVLMDAIFLLLFFSFCAQFPGNVNVIKW